MILTIRTWHVERLNYAAFARISEEEFWPAFEGFEGRALAVWAIRAGGPERLAVMTRYESIDHWLGTRAWGAAADKLKALTEKRDRMILDTDMIALRPVSRRQPQGDAPENTAGVYIREQFRVEPERASLCEPLSVQLLYPLTHRRP